MSNEWQMEMDPPPVPPAPNRLQTAGSSRPLTNTLHMNREQGFIQRVTDVNGNVFTVRIPDDGARPSPVVHAGRAKMPAPPKFGGTPDTVITSVEVWGRDVQRYATRIGIPVREALEVLTQGAARVNVDNMLRDPATAQLSDTAFTDKFVMFYTQQAQPKNIQARDKLYSGAVSMAQGSSLQEYALQFRSVIMDAEPILPMDSIFYFKQGLKQELKSECLTDAMGRQFTSLDALIRHAFVQEQKLLLSRRSAPGPCSALGPARTAELSNVQSGHSTAKRVRFDDQAGEQIDTRNSGRSDFEQAVFHLGMHFGVCGGCLGFLGDDQWHRWADCPINPKNAE
jgi:hypothetical protein